MEESETRNPNIGCFVLPVGDGAILMARHTYQHPDMWVMIGGLAEPGETFAETARREAREETGLDVEIGDLVACVDGGDFVLMVFSGRVVGGTMEPEAAEIAELRWLDADDLGQLHVFDVVKELGPRLLGGDPPAGLAEMTVRWPDGRVGQGFTPQG